MELFHYTSLSSFYLIKASGCLEPSPVRYKGSCYPHVVSLTDHADHSLYGYDTEESPHSIAEIFTRPVGCVRFTVGVADAEPWASWAKRNNVDQRWQEACAGAGWFVVERPIGPDEWVSIDDAYAGENLWLPGKGFLV